MIDQEKIKSLPDDLKVRVMVPDGEAELSTDSGTKFRVPHSKEVRVCSTTELKSAFAELERLRAMEYQITMDQIRNLMHEDPEPDSVNGRVLQILVDKVQAFEARTHKCNECGKPCGCNAQVDYQKDGCGLCWDCNIQVAIESGDYE